MVLVVTKINKNFCGGLCCYVGLTPPTSSPSLRPTSQLVNIIMLGSQARISRRSQMGQVSRANYQKLYHNFFLEISYTPADC